MQRNILALALLLVSGALHAQWTGTWATGTETPNGAFEILHDSTLREIVHISVGGDAVRIKLSNEFGSAPVVIDDAHVALRGTGAAIQPGTDRPLTFNGHPGVTIAPGAWVYSDPATLNAPAASDLAVSLYAKETKLTTVHQGALQTNYLSRDGDRAASADLAGAEPQQSYALLIGVEVQNPNARGAIVALGDSITDGFASHGDTNHRWPNLLADRLLKAGKPYGVLNEGISANRLLHDGGENARYAPGAAALARFDSAVTAQAGVTAVIVLEGINDLGHPGQGAPLSETVSAADIIDAFKQIAARAHAHGIKVYIATILPFEGTRYPGYYTPEKDTKRQQVNAWIRQNKDIDGFFDFEKATHDPAHPLRMLPQYDGGDHLHPSDAGMQAMADAVDLSVF
ncbi:MAG TPA: SGNH/GDSL hydrolase family protein [Terriglobales bacterium]